MSFDYLKYVLPYRRRLQAAGRTVQNRPRVNRTWPQLAGLGGKEYLKRYHKLRKTT